MVSVELSNWQNKFELIVHTSPAHRHNPASFVNAKLRVRPKIQEIHAASGEVLELV